MDKQLNMKTCSKCNLTKLEEDFYKSNNKTRNDEIFESNST